MDPDTRKHDDSGNNEIHERIDRATGCARKNVVNAPGETKERFNVAAVDRDRVELKNRPESRSRVRIVPLVRRTTGASVVRKRCPTHSSKPIRQPGSCATARANDPSQSHFQWNGWWGIY